MKSLFKYIQNHIGTQHSQVLEFDSFSQTDLPLKH